MSSGIHCVKNNAKFPSPYTHTQTKNHKNKSNEKLQKYTQVR